ncbi:MAG: septal ring lytic transglycosylase RlpA family protein [Bauldia sp.]
MLASCSLTGGGATTSGTYGATGTGITASPVPHRVGYELVDQREYCIRGQCYDPAPDPNYSRVGMASWYGADFHGQLTANGENYDMTALTAAHKTLPLPSYVRVTNLANGASVVVRVNDRGPFSNDRIIDMSAQAANMLGFYYQGTAEVRVEYVGRAPLEGDDTEMLLATYVGPGAQPADTMVAYNEQTQQVALGGPRRTFNPFANGAAEAVFTPTEVPAGTDPLAAAIGYAATPMLSPVQQAIQDMAMADRTAAAANGDTVIQVGVFSDRGNVDRITAFLEEFGAVTVSEIDRGDRSLWSVRLTTAAATAGAAIEAAIEAGATGAYQL